MSTDLSMPFQMRGMKGEEITDDTVWITKSHHPHPTLHHKQLTTNMILCCVRNPLDIICSAFQLANTFTHDKEVAQ